MSRKNWIFYSVIVVFLMLTAVACSNLAPSPVDAQKGTALVDLESIEQLQFVFNEDGGNPRLLMILSPL